jgi:hypothetical protein
MSDVGCAVASIALVRRALLSSLTKDKAGIGVKLLSLIMSFMVVAQFTCFTAPAFAADVSYTPGGAGGVKGQVPVNKIGSLLLADAVALLNNNTIEVKGKTKSNSDSKTLLSGAIFKLDVSGGSHPTIHGMAHFTGGESYGTVCKQGGQDLIDTNDGGSISGHITDVTQDQVTVQTPSGMQQIATSSIKRIHSNSVFEFSMPVAVSGSANTSTAFHGDCQRISFTNTPGVTETVTKVSKTPHTTSTSTSEGSTRGKIVAVGICMLLLATAIAVPVAVAVGTHHHHHHTPTPIFFPTTTAKAPAMDTVP